ncbi:PIN domain-containing protein [Salinarimonas sp.]|uniref:PIN domain-containing protein n=1 Tax=Salinarimonas sp. TaxID=2766526 RepID=UPI0032D99B99
MSAFRLCVDLNVWIGAFIADAQGKTGTASQSVVRAIQDGRAALGPLQLAISHAMLSRLHQVMTRHGVSLDEASRLVSLIHALALVGPAAEPPHLVLGGGVLPTRDARMRERDPYDATAASAPLDIEDGRVVDVAVAGRADALVTWNFADFTHGSDTVVIAGRVHVRETAAHRLTIIRTPEMAAWLRSGERPRP